jgi:C4-dicarboxylate transporter, DctQ subunit
VAELLPDRVRAWLDVIAQLVLLLFTVLLAWMLLGRVESAFASNESTFDLRLPVWPWLAAIWLGVVASVFTILSRIVLILLGAAPAPSLADTGPE